MQAPQIARKQSSRCNVIAIGKVFGETLRNLCGLLGAFDQAGSAVANGRRLVWRRPVQGCVQLRAYCADDVRRPRHFIGARIEIGNCRINVGAGRFGATTFCLLGAMNSELARQRVKNVCCCREVVQPLVQKCLVLQPFLIAMQRQRNVVER